MKNTQFYLWWSATVLLCCWSEAKTEQVENDGISGLGISKKTEVLAHHLRGAQNPVDEKASSASTSKSIWRMQQKSAVSEVEKLRFLQQQYISTRQNKVHQQESTTQEYTYNQPNSPTYKTTQPEQNLQIVSHQVMPTQLQLGPSSQQREYYMEPPTLPMQYQQQIAQQTISLPQSQPNPQAFVNVRAPEVPQTGASLPPVTTTGPLTTIFGSVPLASTVGSSLVPSLANPQTLQQLGQLAADIAECDPKKEGLCCMMRDYCDKNADCYSDASPENVFDIAGSIPTCVCRWGFEGDGRTKGSGCSNINECATSAAGCEQLCKDLTPGYACGCLPGFQLLGDGLLCEDINECNTRNGGCQHLCINTLGSYYCKCADGFELSQDGFSCVEIDACKVEDVKPGAGEGQGRGAATLTPCDDECTSTLGVRRCSCKPGYVLSPIDMASCIDRNECTDGVGDGEGPPCKEDGTQQCSNIPGSYTCRCKPGFRPKAPQHKESSKGLSDAAELQGQSVESQQNLLQQLQMQQQQLLHQLQLEQQMSQLPPRRGHVITSEDKGFSRNEHPPLFGMLHWTAAQARDKRSTPPRRLQWDATLDTVYAVAKAAADLSGRGNYKPPSTRGGESDVERAAEVASTFFRAANTATSAVAAFNRLSGNADHQRVQQQQHQQLVLQQQNAARLHQQGSAAERFRPFQSASTEMQQLLVLQRQLLKQQQLQRYIPNVRPAPLECEDINECAESNPCTHPDLVCVNTPGSYQCICRLGYRPRVDGEGCTDVDECSLARIEFPFGTSAGAAALQLQQQTRLRAIAIAREQQQGKLVPGQPAICDQLCTNTEGSYECGCLPGFELKPTGYCADVDECATIEKVCSHGCVNLFGSYRCTCPTGYKLGSSRDDGRLGECEDIDECAISPSPCSHGCQNYPGGFKCTCPDSMMLGRDGRTCREPPTCLEDSTLCTGDSVCRFNSLLNEWRCACPEGFAPSSEGSTKCVDIDECTLGIDDEAQTGKRNPCTDPRRPCCLNIEGGYQCLTKRKRSILDPSKDACEPPSTLS